MRGAAAALPATSRYELLAKIASGGMATVYVGRSRSRGGITRLFAVKRAHPHLLDDAVFRKMFAAEARLASRIHHPNVVAVQDIEELDEELLLVMDYVEGLAFSDLRHALRSVDERTRIRITNRVVLDACAGLEAAHELRNEEGARLDIVHRDVSPHNVLVGVDGVARLTDFGIAKSSFHTGGMTATGGLKGKIGYMAPEYVESSKAEQRADLFGLGAVLWEGLTGERLFQAATEIELMKIVLACRIAAPSTLTRAIPASLDAVVLRALAKSPHARFATAHEFAEALERAARAEDLLASHREVGQWVGEVAHEALEARRAILRQGLGGDAAPRDEDMLAGYEGHERTATLDPGVGLDATAIDEATTVALKGSRSPPLPEPASLALEPDVTVSASMSPPQAYFTATSLTGAPSQAPPATRRTASSSSTWMMLAIAAITVVLVWFGARRFLAPAVTTTSSATSWQTQAPPPPPPPSITSQIPTSQVPPSIPEATPGNKPQAPTPAASVGARSPSGGHRTNAPPKRPPSAPATTTSPVADDPPSHAPPNPYKDAG